MPAATHGEDGGRTGLEVTGGVTRSTGGEDGAAVLEVSGEIDVATGTKLRAALAEGIAEPGVDRVVADLRAVTFMSSTGIAVLVDANAEARQAGKRLSLVAGDNRAVRNPLRVSGVDGLLDLDPLG